MSTACMMFACVLVFPMFLNAQTPGLALGNAGVCNNNAISVPLTGNNLSNIGAITLFIHYDDQSLAFNAIENLNPQLSGLVYNILSNPSRVAIVWSKASGASFMNTTLLNFKFDVIQKNSNLTFMQESCEIADVSLPPQVLSVNYTNGSVYSAEPIISLQPENAKVPSLSDVIFQVLSPDASTYSWQESHSGSTQWSDLAESNTYAGTQTNLLTIKTVPVNFNQNRYRCVLNPGECPAVSAAAILSVDSVTGLSTPASKNILQLRNDPNPFSGTTTLEYSVPEPGFVTIKIFNLAGKVIVTPVEKLHASGIYRIEEDFVYLPNGVYFCHYVFNGAAGMYETTRKLIKLN